MNYKSFEDLPVWQAAIEFSIRVFEFTNKADFRGVGDVKNQLERLPKFAEFKPDILNLKSRVKNISQQLFGWIESLKNSNIKGEKFFNEKEKSKNKNRADWLEFKKELEEAQRINIESTKRAHEQSELDRE